MSSSACSMPDERVRERMWRRRRSSAARRSACKLAARGEEDLDVCSRRPARARRGARARGSRRSGWPRRASSRSARPGVCMRTSRCRACASPWASTPSSSAGLSSVSEALREGDTQESGAAPDRERAGRPSGIGRASTLDGREQRRGARPSSWRPAPPAICSSRAPSEGEDHARPGTSRRVAATGD